MKKILRLLRPIRDFLITPGEDKYRLASWLWLGILFLGGIFLWGHFLAWGQATVEFHDWADITGPRLTFLRDAIVTGQIPLHTGVPTMAGENYVTRIMAIPDIILSPQILLLPFLSIGQFYVFQVLLLFSAGFLGLLLIKRAQEFSLLTFTCIYLLFNFNGHILAHISVGHLTWVGYFLFPWFVLLILDLLNNKGSWQWVIKTAVLLFIILLQGSYHQFVALLFFIGLVGIFNPRYFGLLLKTGILSILLAAVRLLPPVILLNKISSNFLAGYPDLLSILDSLVTIFPPGSQASIANAAQGIGIWEGTIYIGVIGAAFLIYFGFIRQLTNLKAEPSHRKLLLPVLGITILSLDLVYRYLHNLLPLPLITGERLSTRLLSLALVFLIFLAAEEFQKWQNSPGTTRLHWLVVWILTIAGGVDLAKDYFQWSVLSVIKTFSVTPFDASQWYIANDYTDTQYINLIIVGLIITLACLSFMVFMAIRERRRYLPAKMSSSP